MEGNRVGVMRDLDLGDTGGDSWTPCHVPRSGMELCPASLELGMISPYSALPSTEGSHAHAAGQRGGQSHQEGNRGKGLDRSTQKSPEQVSG